MSHRLGGGRISVGFGGRARRLALLAPLAFVVACASPPPPDTPLNACAIFAERRVWYDAVRDAEDRWDAPPHVVLAIIRQESGFDGDARPDRTRFLWVLPGPRPSTAFGYAQATNPTWEQYKDETGRRFADRDNFRAAADFVGWYMRKSRRISGIPMHDARRQYLAYHEGWGGYNSGSHRRNQDLLRVADSVASVAGRYERQLDSCRRDLRRRFLFFF